MIALLPPSSRIVRPRRSPTVLPTWKPIDVDPVNEMSGMRLSWSIRSPIVEPLPTESEKMAGSYPFARATSAAIFVTAMAVKGVVLDGFHRTESPQTAARAVFQLQTAVGKLNDVMTPITPNGCHCSWMR